MSFYKMWFITLILAAAFMTSCGSDSSTDTVDGGGGVVVDPDAPTVTSTIPGTLETNLIGDDITATFSEEMDAATLISPEVTFTVIRKSDSVNIPGIVTYSGNVATFNPDSDLTLSVIYTASINTGAKDLAGNPLAAVKTWDFIVGPANPLTVDLGTATDFAIVAQSKITTTGVTVITGDTALAPAAKTLYEGFSYSDSGFGWGTSIYVPGGRMYADFTGDIVTAPAAKEDKDIAYTDIGSRAVNFVNLGGPVGEIGSLNLCRGVYNWDSGLNISNDVILTGSATDVWIFRVSGNSYIASGKKITLAGGAQAKNIFWRSTQTFAFDTTSLMEGTVLSGMDITLANGAGVNGRLMAATAVTLDASPVTKPAP